MAEPSGEQGALEADSDAGSRPPCPRSTPSPPPESSPAPRPVRRRSPMDHGVPAEPSCPLSWIQAQLQLPAAVHSGDPRIPVGPFAGIRRHQARGQHHATAALTDPTASKSHTPTAVSGAFCVIPVSETALLVGREDFMTGSRLRTRFWIEVRAAGLSSLTLVVTIIWRSWIEVVLRVDPDHGSGAAEWGVVMSLAALTVLVVSAARRERSRPFRLAATVSLAY
jgi:hypothetical protein